MRRDVKTDWTVRDDVRAKLRSMIRRALVRVKYPSQAQGRVISWVIGADGVPRPAPGRLTEPT